MSQQLLHEIFGQNAVKYVNNIAVQEENTAISYGQLWTKVQGFVDVLSAVHLRSGDIVAVLVPPGIDWITTVTGIFSSEAVYLPLTDAYPDKKIAEIYAQTKFKYIIVAPCYLNRVQALLKSVFNPDITLLLWTADGSLQALQVSSRDNSGDVSDHNRDNAYILYTSGTTGQGKAILGSRKGLAHFINWQAKEFSLVETCRVGQLTSMVFDASFRDIFLPLSVGGTLCIPGDETRKNTGLLVKWISEYRISLIHCVPAIWRLIIKQLADEPKGRTLVCKLRHLFLAGEPLYAKDVWNWRKVAGELTEIINLYGTSETTMAKTFYRVNELPADGAQVLPVGKPIDNTVVAVISRDRLCRTGELGEIYIKTPYWSNGYYNNDPLTRTVFVQNPLVNDHEDIVYKTGDLGRYLPDQSIEVIGRIDDQVKINGVRVDLGEIEQAVLRVPGLSEVVIKPRTDTDGTQQLVCYYVDPQISGDEIRTFLAAELTADLIPAYYVGLPELPLTINGKVNKKALPDPEEINNPVFFYEAPKTDTEIHMEAIWKAVLNKRRVSCNESFFLIGGNSLKAIQVVSRISREFKVQIKVAEIFNNQTISKLSRVVDKAIGGNPEEIPLCPMQEYYDMSHAQRSLWALYQIDPSSYAYNIPQAFKLNGQIDIGAFQQALDAVTARHEILRTNFKLVEGRPSQHVHAVGTVPFEITLVDLSNEQEQGKRLKQLLHDDAVKPFDLSNDRLLNARIYRLSEDSHVFFINMHHIITDQWSEGVFFSEMLKAYRLLSQEQEPSFSPLKLQYKDFAAWHNHKLQLAAHQEHRKYWMTHLGSGIPELVLPLDFPRPEVRTPAGNSVMVNLDKTSSKQIMTLAFENNTGPFSVLLAAINVMMFKFTDHRQVIIGTPWACRNPQELEEQIGFYVNTLAIRLELQEDESFIQHLQSVKELVLQTAKHQDYPFDMLLEDLKLKRKHNRSPVFDIGFTWHDLVNTVPECTGLEIIPYELDFIGTKSDLWFHGAAENNSICLSLEYSTDLFKESTAQLLLTELQKILIHVAKDSAVSVRSLVTGGKEEESMHNAPSIGFNF